MLKPNETVLIGKWTETGNSVVCDAICHRIEALIAHHLVPVTSSADGWSSLFQDPNDLRYWERTFPQSNWQGGGPPSLIYISASDAQTKYGQ
ncbi:MAG: Imm27 family immunity protein [Methylophilaceae bacterium]